MRDPLLCLLQDGANVNAEDHTKTYNAKAKEGTTAVIAADACGPLLPHSHGRPSAGGDGRSRPIMARSQYFIDLPLVALGSSMIGW